MLTMMAALNASWPSGSGRNIPDAIVYDTDPPTRYGNLSLPAIVLSLYFDRVVQVRPDAGHSALSRASDRWSC